MTKFIQVCASQNDLFALDAEGDIYQYDFNVKTWIKLIATRELEGEESVRRGVAPTNGSAAGERRVGKENSGDCLEVSPARIRGLMAGGWPR